MNYHQPKIKQKITLIAVATLLLTGITPTTMGQTDPGFQTLRSLIENSNLNTGTTNGLLAKLRVAEDQYNKDHLENSLRMLQNIIEWIQNQSPNLIPPETAEQITQATENLIFILENQGITFLEIGVTSAEQDTIATTALATIALEDVNNYLEEMGSDKRLQVNIKSNQASSEIALQNTIDYHLQGIDIIIGHGWSSQCLASLDYVNENNMLLLSPSSTYPELGLPGDNLLRISPTDEYQAQRLADFLQLNGVQAIYILDGYDQFTNALIDACVPEIEVLGVTGLPYDERDLSPQLDEAEAAFQQSINSGYTIDSLAFIVSETSNKIVDTAEFAESYGYETLGAIPWYRLDLMTPLTMGEAARLGDFAVEHGLFTAAVQFDTESPRYQSLVDRYYALTGEQIHDFSLYAYDCYWLIAEAILQSDQTDAMTIKQTILDICDGENPTYLTALSLILTQIAQGDSYTGVTGDITFNEDGDRESQDYALEGYAWIDQTLETTNYATYDSDTDTVEPLEVTQSPPEIIHLGYTSSTWDGMRSARDIISLAQEDINTKQIEQETGKWFEIELKCNYGSTDTALQNVEDFHTDGINFINGHGWSGQCSGSLDYINTNDILLLSPSSTAPSLAIEDNLYRFCTNDLVAGKVLVKLYQELGKTDVVILFRDDVWGGGLAQAVQQECIAEGINVLGYLPYPDDLDWNSYLNQVEQIMIDSGLPPEQIAFEIISYSEIVQALHEYEPASYPMLSQVTWFGSDGTILNQQIVDEVFDKAYPLKILGPIAATPRNLPEFIDLNQRYLALNGVDMTLYLAASYDILTTLADLIVAHGTDPLIIKDEIEQLLDHPGASGLITLDQYGDRDGANYDIWGYGYDGDFGSVLFGEYDLATDSITMFDLPPLPDLMLYNTQLWTHTRYYPPTDDVRYELVMKTGAYSQDGPTDIQSVTVTLPDGTTTIDLTDSYEIWGEQPDDGVYFMVEELETPVSGEFTYSLTDQDQNIVQETITYDGWLSTPYTLHTPSYRTVFPDSNNIEFTWSHPDPDLEYGVHIWNDEYDVDWWYHTYETSVTYEGEPLPEGLYNFGIDASNRENGNMCIESEFIVGTLPLLEETRVFTFVGYRESDPSNKWYTINLDTKVIVDDYSKIEYVKAFVAGCGEYYLEPEFDENSPPWDLGEYSTHIHPDDKIYGDISFEVNYDSTLITETMEIPGWLDTEFTDLVPTLGAYYPNSDNLEFSWNLDEDIQDYGVQIRYNDEDILDESTETNLYTYEGELLQSGRYDFNIRAHSHDPTGVSVDSYFYVGDPFQLSLMDSWSMTRYNLGDLSEPNEYELGVKTSIFAETGLGGLDYIVLWDPNGEIHELEEEPDEGPDIYKVDAELNDPLSGWYTLEASHQDYGVITQDIYFDNWITQRFNTITPSYMDNVESPFTISWTSSHTDIDEYRVEVWNEDNTVDWSSETQDTSIVYSEPLEDGLYQLRIIAQDENDGEIRAESQIWVGEDPLITGSRASSRVEYELEDPTDINYDLRFETKIISEDYNTITAMVEYPDGTVYPLEQDWEPNDPYSYGRYTVDERIDQPIGGEFILTVESPGDTQTDTIYYDQWLITPFTTVTPQTGAIFESSDDLVFTWSHPDPEICEYHVRVETQDETIWDEDTYENMLEYTGDTLEPGVYRCQIEAEYIDDTKICAESYFFIGTSIAILETDIEAWNGYSVTNPVNQWPELRIRTRVKAANPIQQVTVTYPDSTVYTLTLKDPDDDEYEYTTPGITSGTFTITAQDIETNTATYTTYFDNWITTPFTSITPTYGTTIYQGDLLEFSWSHPEPDLEYELEIWGNGIEYKEQTETDTTHTYQGSTLSPGTYGFLVKALNENGGEINAFSSFTVILP